MRTSRTRFPRTLVAATALQALVAGSLLASPAIHALERAPLAFVANDGQLPETVFFNARTPQADVFLTREGAVLSLQGKDRHATLRIALVGSQGSEALVAKEPLAGKVNLFLGSDPARWRTNIPTYGRVLAPGVMPGVDAVYYGNGRSLEFDFVVAPGVDAGALRLRLEGADRLAVNAAGNLTVAIAGGSVELQAPVVYQDGAEGRTPVDGRYVVTGKDEVAFELRGRDPARAVVIDPTITYSTFLGGTLGDHSNSVASGPADGLGGRSFYIAGGTTSTDFPGRTGPRPFNTSPLDNFVSKFDSSGRLLWSVYLGGEEIDINHGLAVDASGNAWVVGTTKSREFPTTPFAFQRALAGDPLAPPLYDVYLAEVSSDGSSLLYSTYYGGSGTEGNGTNVRLFSSGGTVRAYVPTGTTSSDVPIPLTARSYKRTRYSQPASYWDACLAVFDTSLATSMGTASLALVYATYLGGTSNDQVGGIGIDGAGNAYVGGLTWSPDFPTKNAHDSSYNGGADAFVTKLDPAIEGPTGLMYSTFLGGSGSDVPRYDSLDVNAAGDRVVIAGWTESYNFPMKNPLIPSLWKPPQKKTGGRDCFATLLNPNVVGTAALLYSTYLTGAGGTTVYSVKIVGPGKLLLAGDTTSTSFPTTVDAFQRTHGGASDGFLMELDTNLSGAASRVYSTYLGGSGGEGCADLDVAPAALADGTQVPEEWFVSGGSDSSPCGLPPCFPITDDAEQPIRAGAGDAFVVRLRP